MNDHHLSAFEQEEYVLGQQTPGMLRHLTECDDCRASVTRLEQGLAAFRTTAIEWSDACLSTRPQQLPKAANGPILSQNWAMRWAVAGALPLVLLVLGLFFLHTPRQQAVQPVASISDDALLDQVDDQLSVAVPSSMESLTHLVSTSHAGANQSGGKHLVQTN